MKVITTDFINFQTGIICHLQLTGVMGTRLALRLYRRFPELRRHYRREGFALGQLRTDWIHESLCVANLGAISLRGLHYPSLNECLKLLYEQSLTYQLTPYIPYGLGCGVMEGNWDNIERMISHHCPTATICKLPTFNP